METTTNRKIKALAFALALGATVSAQAFAADIVSPRGSVTLSKNVLTVGDVFEGVQNDADHILAPAPDYGKTMRLSAQDLSRISNAFNLGWYGKGNESVVIKRESNSVDRYHVEDAIEDALKEELPGQKFDVELSDRNLAIHLPTGEDTTVSIDKLKYDVNKGEFRALATAGKERREVSGRLFAVTELPVLNKALRSGDVIGAGDIQYIDMRSNEVSPSMIVSAESLIGQTPRRGVAAMKPVTASDVTLPSAIKKGELVTMTLQNAIIQLTTQGRSLQDAKVGDVIRVVNTSSNQTIEAVVTGPRTVAVKPPSDALVNMPTRNSLDKG